MRLPFCLFLLSIALVPGFAEDHWTRLATPHFELYTTAPEKKAREALLFSEQVRSFFLETSGSKKAPDFPIRIVAFNSEKQYAPYKARSTAFAYYTSGRMRDYIVMQDVSGEHYPVALHEYTHLVLRHTGLKFPPWMNEGWAEVYSSLRSSGQQVLVGDVLPGRLRTLRASGWIPLRVLTRVDHSSALYNDRDQVASFYAQSWALVHMLMLWPDYRPKFGAFALAIGSGKSFEESCQAIYGKPAEQVEQDLRVYFDRHALYAAKFDVRLEKSAQQPEQREVLPFESRLMLADLLATIRKTEQAEAAYRELAEADPHRPELNESLGYLAWQKNDIPKTIEYFGKAFDAGTSDPQMCYHYAMLLHNHGAKAAATLPALRLAVALKPNYTEARMELGMSLMEVSDFSGALNTLSVIQSVKAEEAARYFAARSYASLRTGDRENAQKFGEFAKKYARTPQEREQADSVLRYLSLPQSSPRQDTTMAAVDEWAKQHPPMLQHSDLAAADEHPEGEPEFQKAEGVALRLDCSTQNKSARLTVLVQGQEQVFDIEDPAKIQLRHPGQSTHDFQCGPQDSLRVVIEYLAIGGKNVIKILEF